MGTLDNMTTARSTRLLVLGATGYVGGRLVPTLLRRGHDVRCLVRTPPTGPDWVGDVELVSGDLFDPPSLERAFDGVDTVVYLVHSLGSEDFEDVEQECARNVRVAADRAGVHHIVYLSGLGDDGDELSPHLRSRHRVGSELAKGSASVTELRAAIILGAGSASFEMLRSLTEVLPVMVAPSWVTRTKVQPIGIDDVLRFLGAAIDQGPNGHHRLVEIGGPDVLTYRGLIDLYAEVAGLRRRRIIPVPFVTPRLSTHWVNLVTPLPRRLAASLIDSLRNDVVVTNDSARELSGRPTGSARSEIAAAISAIQDLDVPTRWSGIQDDDHAGRPRPWDAAWAGGRVLDHVTSRSVDASTDTVQRTVRGIGGERGWYGFGPLWRLRGALDKVVGGVGLRRGRRHPDQIFVGEALDFWRVEAIEPDLFRLHAEMKLPGEAWLEWRTRATAGGATEIEQHARFVPRGVGGRMYWWLLWPVHVVLFPFMLNRIGNAAEQNAVAESVHSGEAD